MESVCKLKDPSAGGRQLRYPQKGAKQADSCVSSALSSSWSAPLYVSSCGIAKFQIACFDFLRKWICFLPYAISISALVFRHHWVLDIVAPHRCSVLLSLSSEILKTASFLLDRPSLSLFSVLFLHFSSFRECHNIHLAVMGRAPRNFPGWGGELFCISPDSWSIVTCL